jgi:CRP-like cAMP-binding protein
MGERTLSEVVAFVSAL